MDRHVPSTSAAISGVDDVAAGTFSTCARMGNTVRCWGNNQAGQLGDGTTTNRTQPVQVLSQTSPPTPLSGVTQLSLGAGHVCVLLGTAPECWGDDSIGELGDGRMGTNVYRSLPAPVLRSGQTLTGVANLGSGPNALGTCAQLESGEILCWGYQV